MHQTILESYHSAMTFTFELETRFTVSETFYFLIFCALTCPLRFAPFALTMHKALTVSSPCFHKVFALHSMFTYRSVRIYYIEADNNTIHRWWHFKKCQLFTHNFEQISIENIWMGFTSFFSLRNRIYCLFFIYWIANNSKFLMSKHESLVMLYVNCWHLKVQRRTCCVHRIISIST